MWRFMISHFLIIATFLGDPGQFESFIGSANEGIAHNSNKSYSEWEVIGHVLYI